jgi:hypothetical protein
MSLKRVILLAGAALLVAACNSGITAPVGAVRGGAPSNAKAAPDTTKTATPPATTNSENSEWCNWTVALGWSDSSCVNPEP